MIGVGKIRSDGETLPHDGETPPLWRVLDLILEVYVLAVDCDVEVANFAMMTVVVAGERLGLSDQVLQSMLTSAIAEGRCGRQRRRTRYGVSHGTSQPLRHAAARRPKASSTAPR